LLLFELWIGYFHRQAISQTKKKRHSRHHHDTTLISGDFHGDLILPGPSWTVVGETGCQSSARASDWPVVSGCFHGVGLRQTLVSARETRLIFCGKKRQWNQVETDRLHSVLRLFTRVS